METIYDVDYFIKKFEAIPEMSWYVGDYENPLNPNQKCAAGWCGGNKNGMIVREASALYEVWQLSNKKATIADVNDGKIIEYPQQTAKQRVLAFLYDIYEKTYGRKYAEIVEPKEKVIYKTVVIDSAVKTLQGTLSEN